jgi:hypothetical protein
MNPDTLTRKQRMMRIGAFFGLGALGAILIWFPSAWIFDQVALRVAFTRQQLAQQRITVDYVTKPSTVTFSNGRSLDVGYRPAKASGACTLVLALPCMLFMRYFIKRWLPFAPSESPSSR